MADMNSAIASVSSGIAQTNVKAEADVAVLRKALDAQAIHAAQLIESLPDMNPVSAPSAAQDPTEMLGSLLNVRA